MQPISLYRRGLYGLICLWYLFMPPVFAADAPSSGDKQKKAALITYKPPFRGAPSRRTGAGTRGICGSIPGLETNFSLFPLVPSNTALSSTDQPVLYWAVSHPFAGKFVLTITPQAEYEFDYPDSILEISLVMTVDAGVQQLNLDEFSIKLQPHQVYHWTISLVCDPQNRSLDLHAGGTMQYQPVSAQLKQALLTHHPKEHPILYAKYGFWYDALHSLSEQVRTEPDLKPVRTALLDQVGLQKVSQWWQ